MHRLRRSSFLCLCVLLVEGCAPPERPSDFYEVGVLPFEILSDLEIARSATFMRSPSLTLACTSTRELRLILFARLPGPREFVRVGERGEVSIFVNGIENELKISAELMALGKRDTIVGSVLPRDDARRLAQWLGATPPQRVSFVGFHETGFRLRSAVSGDQLRLFSDQCLGQASTDGSANGAIAD